MKKIVLALFLFLALSFNLSYAQCPQDLNDYGVCDTLYTAVYPYADTCFNNNCTLYRINTSGQKFPAFVYIPIYITHDVPDPIDDSMAAFVIPLGITHTNAAAYCSASGYWNTVLWGTGGPTPTIKRSIFRNIPNPGWDSTNWMMDLFNEGNGEEWNSLILNLASDSAQMSGIMTPPHWFLSAIPTGQEDRGFGDTQKKLFATVILRVQDTMTIVIDSTFWPPNSRFAFTPRGHGALSYIPRMPTLPDTIRVKPDGTVSLVEGLHQLPAVPTVFSLSQNYPNPFNANTTIEFSVIGEGNVNLEIYNILGRKVETLVNNKKMERGTYKVNWNAYDASSGVYFYKLTQDNSILTKKMILLK